MQIVVLEGLDSSGKTTIIGEIKKRYGDRLHPIFIDRFVYSSYVYNRLREKEYTRHLTDIFPKFIGNFDIHIFFIDVSPSLAFERAKNKKDEYTYSVYELVEMREYFLDSFDIFQTDRLHIINGDRNLNKVVNEICSYLIMK